MRLSVAVMQHLNLYPCVLKITDYIYFTEPVLHLCQFSFYNVMYLTGSSYSKLLLRSKRHSYVHVHICVPVWCRAQTLVFFRWASWSQPVTQTPRSSPGWSTTSIGSASPTTTWGRICSLTPSRICSIHSTQPRWAHASCINFATWPISWFIPLTKS